MIKLFGATELPRGGYQWMRNAVVLDRARREAGLIGIASEGLRKRCWEHCTEVVSCMRTWNGLK